MATYEASVKKALTASQQDFIDHKEHCSVDPVKLATVGRERGHQVRIKRNDSEYGLYTVSQVRQERPDNIVRMGSAGRKRLGTSDEFVGSLDSQVPHPTFDDAEAEANNEFVERLEDNGTHTGLVVIAPHGGDIEPIPTNRPSAWRRDSRPRGLACGGARALRGKPPLLAGTSPRPTFTRRVFPSSARSFPGASSTRSPSMASTTPKSPSTFSSAGLRPTPFSNRSRLPLKARSLAPT